MSAAESYVSAADCSTYASNRSLAFAGAAYDQEAALRRATAFIDAAYRQRFSGFPRFFGTQALEWPRNGAVMSIPDDGRSEAFTYDHNRGYYVYLNGIYYFPPNVVPKQIVSATCEAAIRELAKPGVMAPDLKRGGSIKRVQAGSVSIEYGTNATANTTFQAIDLALASLLMPANPYSGRSARG